MRRAFPAVLAAALMLLATEFHGQTAMARGGDRDWPPVTRETKPWTRWWWHAVRVMTSRSRSVSPGCWNAQDFRRVHDRFHEVELVNAASGVLTSTSCRPVVCAHRPGRRMVFRDAKSPAFLVRTCTCRFRATRAPVSSASPGAIVNVAVVGGVFRCAQRVSDDSDAMVTASDE